VTSIENFVCPEGHPSNDEGSNLQRAFYYEFARLNIISCGIGSYWDNLRSPSAVNFKLRHYSNVVMDRKLQ